MALAGLRNGNIVGFKYFGFGGLAQADKGLPAFEGTKQGNKTQFCLHLTPGGKGAFKVHVMLDGPYANPTWKGREIAVINVPADAPREPRVCNIPADAVEGLTGKHAIYLVVEGPEVEEPQQQRQFGRRQGPQRPQGLFDLHGLGFSKGGSIEVPLCLQKGMTDVAITVDGKQLVVPSTPVYTSNANGYIDVTHYQVYGPLRQGSVLKASSPNPDVKFQISPIADGRATVRATYHGKEKVYLIN
jgi:hypothetical protein